MTCPPGEQHWRDAIEDRFMEHLAIRSDGQGTPEATWFEELTYEQYHPPAPIGAESSTLTDTMRAPVGGYWKRGIANLDDHAS